MPNEDVTITKAQYDALMVAVETLDFYADPETYFAIGFFPDSPCGEFMEDFSEDDGHVQLGFKPGKRARKALDDLYAVGIGMVEDDIESDKDTTSNHD